VTHKLDSSLSVGWWHISSRPHTEMER